jgi:hypothetical protein
MKSLWAYMGFIHSVLHVRTKLWRSDNHITTLQFRHPRLLCLFDPRLFRQSCDPVTSLGIYILCGVVNLSDEFIGTVVYGSNSTVMVYSKARCAQEELLLGWALPVHLATQLPPTCPEHLSLRAPGLEAYHHWVARVSHLFHPLQCTTRLVPPASPVNPISLLLLNSQVNLSFSITQATTLKAEQIASATFIPPSTHCRKFPPRQPFLYVFRASTWSPHRLAMRCSWE